MSLKKSLFVLTLAGFVFISCKDTAKEVSVKKETSATASTAKTVIVGKIETASFHIEGMSCAVMCAAKIEKELASMDGVQQAKVDFDKKTATIQYDNAKQSPEKLVEKVESVADGKTYKVSDVKSSGDHAMLMTGDPVKGKKAKKKTKKATVKSCEPNLKKEGKPACCSGKKHCSEEKAI